MYQVSRLQDPVLHSAGIKVGASAGGVLIVADGLCPLIAELAPGALHELVSLGKSSNPLQAITQELSQRRLACQPVEVLHIIAHGQSGVFRIGDQWIDASTLVAQADQLRQWQVGTVALWSCEVGADRDFVSVLAELTGAKTYSSNKELGDSQKQWTLAREGGETLSSERVFRSSTLGSWVHKLASVT